MSFEILLVEDDAPTRRRMAEVIVQHPELALAGTAGDCAGAREALAAATPDAVLCDLGLPDGSGIDLIREICQRTPPPLVMVVSGFGDEAHVVNAIRAGACAYLLKGASPREMHQAILDMRAGGSPISAAVARHLLTQLRPAASGGAAGADEAAAGFTERELEVLQFVAKGYTYQEIADGLVISINTIREHIRHIYSKLAVGSRGEAVHEAQALGLIRQADMRPD